MPTRKIYDLAVKVGEYTDRDGNKKGRYMNVGAVLEKDDGGRFMMLERTFNPAGAPNPDGRTTVLLSMFEPRDREDTGGGGGQRQQPAQQQQRPQRQAPVDDVPFDDDVPFS